VTGGTPPRGIRRLRGLAAAFLAAAFLSLPAGDVASSPLGRDPAGQELARARDWAAGLASRAAADEPLGREELVQAGYLERLRLGLGSPFRLMDAAAHDARLDTVARRRLEWALLAATAEGRGYEIDPAALASLAADPAGRCVDAGRRHLGFITQTVVEGSDPRDGELAVRAAYTLAAAEGVVGPTAPQAAATAAALVRDREMARGDAARLLQEAQAGGSDPLALVQRWRSARRFQTEAPAARRTPGSEARAAAAAPALAASIRQVVVTAPACGLPSGEPARPSLLGPAAAARLAALAHQQGAPPHAAVSTTLDQFRVPLSRALDGGEGGAELARLLDAGRDEESFVAAYARLSARHPSPAVARLGAATALAMRAFAQEKVWYPGAPAPSDAELKRRWNAGAVEFDDGVPERWKPYYRRMVGDALRDLARVVPRLDLGGTRFRVGQARSDGMALAIFDARARRIHIPPASGPGTIAHEVAHALDARTARARYAGQGSYATDAAARSAGGDRFASAVRALPVTSAGALALSPEARREYESRPAETFARYFAGYVSSALAERGRSNGALSSFQDDLLTGTAVAVAPGSAGGRAKVFFPVLATITGLPPRAAAELAGRAPAAPSPLQALAEFMADAEGDAKAAREDAAPGLALVDRWALGEAARLRIAGIAHRRDAILARRDSAALRTPFPDGARRRDVPTAILLHAAAEARVNGLLAARARALGLSASTDELRSLWLGPVCAGPDGSPEPEGAWPALPGISVDTGCASGDAP
jgi:hypothetical protein